MARARLSIPVQSISTRLTPNDIRALSNVEIESEAWYEAQQGAATYSDRPEKVERTFVDMRPRGAHAHAFA